MEVSQGSPLDTSYSKETKLENNTEQHLMGNISSQDDVYFQDFNVVKDITWTLFSQQNLGWTWRHTGMPTGTVKGDASTGQSITSCWGSTGTAIRVRFSTLSTRRSGKFLIWDRKSSGTSKSTNQARQRKPIVPRPSPTHQVLRATR